MKNAKAKGKDGKPHKKLRVAKFNFCTIGMLFPFRNSMAMYDCRSHINNNYISLNKNSQNDFSAYSYNFPSQNLQSSHSPQQSSPISVNIGQQSPARSFHYDNSQYYDHEVLKNASSERDELNTFNHQYYSNQASNFSNKSEKINENNYYDEQNFQENGNQRQVNEYNSKNEDLLDYNSKKDDDIKLFLSSCSEPSSFQNIIPSSFDIVKRGPLPSIMLRSNGKVELSDF